MNTREPLEEPTVLVRRWRRLGVVTQDAALAAFIGVAAFVPTLSHLGPAIGDLPAAGVGGRGGDAVDMALTVALCAPLALRRRHPSTCLAVIGMAFVVCEALGRPDTFGTVALLLALYAAGAYPARTRLLGAMRAIVASTGYLVLVLVLHDRGSPQGPADYVAFFGFLVGAWLAGAVMARWRREEAGRRELAAQLAVAEERARIARELHDVVTHHVTAMVVQAEAARYVLTAAPDQAEQGLSAIGETGRRALNELRSLLDVIDASGDHPSAGRAPVSGELSELVELTRSTGQPVQLVELGPETPVPPAVQLALYRVVQECLTNAVRHATGWPTHVVVRRTGTAVDVEVTTERPTDAANPVLGAAVPRPLSSGRGLAGLDRRVRSLGGQLTVERQEGSSFSVRASLPLAVSVAGVIGDGR